MGWPNTALGILSLRTLIGDGPQDKLCANKKLIGTVDGINTTFKTFEFRRLGTFSPAATGETLVAFPLGVFINGLVVDPAVISSDDPSTGIFTLASTGDAPGARDSFTATYFYQWFTDSELDIFLQNASTWLGYGPQYQNLVDGLNAAALRFAAQEAYEKAAMKYSTRVSETYKLEDAPSEDILKAIAAFKDMADNFMDKARDFRDDYYKRQGQPLAPNFAFSLGRVVDPTPRR